LRVESGPAGPCRSADQRLNGVAVADDDEGIGAP
jgi:hypothetical protein